MKNLITRFFIVFFALFTPSGFVFAEANGEIGTIEGVKSISLAQAQAMLDQNNTYFFDVNSEQDRQTNGYIPNSISTYVENWQNLLPQDKNANLVFYGLNRFRFEASQAAAVAIELGYKNSVVMLDGIESWVTSGRKVEKIDTVKWEKAKEIIEFKDTIHSRFKFSNTPSCRDCHAQKDKGIRADIAASKNLINQKCATCHEKASNALAKSAHGVQEFLPNQSTENKKEKPSCITCHSIHVSPKHSGIYSQKQLVDQKCAQCHKQKTKTFHMTFHGKGMVLSTPGETPSVATCSDCHGKHNILKSTERSSSLFPINRVQTCQSCHPNSNENFVNWMAHADHGDGENYPGLHGAYIFMTILVISVFVFFGAHTILWCLRLIAMRIKYPKEWKEARKAAHEDRVKVRRFTTLHRIQHFFMAASFLGLAFSGLPQKFYDSPWAKPMIDLMGGDIVHAATIHHISAIVMFAVFFSHIGEIIIVNWKRRDVARDPITGKISFIKVLKATFGPDSLMPNLQDLKDMKDHFKWFFGFGSRPQFDRWTYWEKFDYLAVFWGMFIIGISGLVLWFPTFFGKFLPGEAINIATLLHSDEALLATGFIFAIHFFNTHFRADRFPMDMVIFSGSISEEEIKQERSVWYKRLKESGKLSTLYENKSNSKIYQWLSKFIGFAMLITGLVFLSLMLYTFFNTIL
ncbi:cytochrome c family protein [Campylobacter subantarcticus LMG 24377]|uniref:Cytochrome c family protein n=1 Tax=Campylobacter subantarcticus TaxID=497724 RepID=A0ABW9N728_9BACT|nr:cytochrome c family protein [Campylobacter subantarcticus]AJC92468.1 cytochrome c family protein [Campylobacter subantarcticus LMG 24377]EAL3939528.1 cytochrome c family protein [Campylobacter lari]MPC00051.1 cytochrome c family protein [Campylobacter subantarcticus]